MPISSLLAGPSQARLGHGNPFLIKWHFRAAADYATPFFSITVRLCRHSLFCSTAGLLINTTPHLPHPACIVRIRAAHVPPVFPCQYQLAACATRRTPLLPGTERNRSLDNQEVTLKDINMTSTWACSSIAFVLS